MKLVSILFLLFFLFKVQAQDIWTKEASIEFNNSILEFVELRNQELLMELDSIKGGYNNNPVTEEELLIFKRTKILSKTIPLDYNDHVKSYIDKYVSNNYRPYMNRMLGLGQHYFPIYESILREYDIPEEVKYLSLVESSLNPHLVSTSGAVGPWQFMYVTAKEYNLEMNAYYDERKDPYSSSHAVSQYLADAYNQFGDWLVAIASYNCGKGCVRRAIERSGIERPTFWELSPFLPQETRNYIPKFIAMTYVLSDPSFYNIIADESELNLQHQVLFVDKGVKLTPIAQAIGVSQEELKSYNPSFKKDIINGSPEKPKRLILPLTDIQNDSLLYLALHDNVSISIADESTKSVKRYYVKKGESLHSLSKKFNVSVQNLKAWNALKSNSNIAGKTLIVSKPVGDQLVNNVKIITSSRNSNSSIYTVKAGDSLDRIAKKYNGVTVSKLKADNGLKSDIIKPGMKLRINRG